MKSALKKIVVTGTESTGKSTLCEQLAAHFGTVWCPEYARKYLKNHGNVYSYNDLLSIAKGQLLLEEEMTANAKNNLVFIDTDMYVMKIWSEFVYGKCDLWILDQIVQRKYDLYLLCDIDLPWQNDQLREYPEFHTRQLLHYIYKDCMIHQSTPWEPISGLQEERLNKAIKAVEKLI